MWQYCLKEKNILLFIRELIFEKVNIVISLSIAPAFPNSILKVGPSEYKL